MAWEEGKCLVLDDYNYADAVWSTTVMLVEVRGSQIHWAEPVDFDGTGSLKINAPQGLSIGSHEVGGAHVCFAGGIVEHVPDTTSEEEVRALLTRDGGEMEDWPSGCIDDESLGKLRWSGESWEGFHYPLSFSIDFEVVDPTNQERLLAVDAARKACRGLWDRMDEEKAKLDAAKEVTEAAHSQSDDTPTDEDVQRLADDMTLESWGMTYATDDAAIFPYLVYTSPKCFPNKRIRVRFSIAPGGYGNETLIKAIDEVTVTE